MATNRLGDLFVRNSERRMQISTRALVTLIHGLLTGGAFILGAFGVIVELIRSTLTEGPCELTATGYRVQRAYLIATAAIGWIAVLLGTFVVYPWYRAIPPAGANLVEYPQRFLLSSATTAGWHEFGMEWKEHIGWLAPMGMTMLAYVLTKHRQALKDNRPALRAVLVFALAVFLCAGIAGFFGAMINKFAPIAGGATLHF
jgi:hypothetical protein